MERLVILHLVEVKHDQTRCFRSMIQHIFAVSKSNACVGSQEHTKPQAGDEGPAYGWIRHAALMCLLFEARSELKRYQFSPLLCRIGHRRVRVHASPEAAADIEAWPQSRPDSPFDAGSSFSVDRDTAETASPNPRIADLTVSPSTPQELRKAGHLACMCRAAPTGEPSLLYQTTRRTPWPRNPNPNPNRPSAGRELLSTSPPIPVDASSAIEWDQAQHEPQG